MNMICFAVYCATVLPLFDFKAIQVYFDAVCITSTLFLICYWGSEISSAGQTIGDSCFNSAIFGSDIRFQKSLSLIILRSQKPIVFSVGKFGPLCVAVFVWIMKHTYTLLMVLRKSTNMQLK